MFFIKERVFDAGPVERFRQMRFPNSLGEPNSPGPLSETVLEVIVHHPELALPVLLGDNGQDGLIETSAEKLDLASLNQNTDQIQAFLFFFEHEFPKGA